MATAESIVGLDIGTSKVTAVIADHDEHEQLAILGVGTAVSSGLRRGVVINIEATLRSVVDAIEAAEQMAGHEVQAVVSAVAGSHIEGINSHGVVAVSGKGREGREVTALDIDRAVAGARAISIPMDREILHVLPREFTVDDQTGIHNPLDMIGVRLEVDVHIVTGSVTATQNLVKCINRAGFQVASVAFGSFAAAEAVLEQDEKDLGAIVIDIGGGNDQRTGVRGRRTAPELRVAGRRRSDQRRPVDHAQDIAGNRRGAQARRRLRLRSAGRTR